jgi:hypothetical protein
MRQLLVASAVAVGVSALLSARPAFAQYPYPTSTQSPTYRPTPNVYARPGLSPYLNLLRGGSPAANYFLGVVPERERRATSAQYGTAILDLERRAAPSPAIDELVPELPSTGHPTGFLNYGNYYGFGTGPRTFPPVTQAAPPPRRTR